MQSLGQALREVAENMTDSPSDQVHVCQFCEKVVGKITVHVLGVPKIVQPRCKCEVENWENGITDAELRKTNNEIERRFSFAALGDRFKECRFSSFHIRGGSETAANLARDYAYNYPIHGGESLLMWGPPGNGKSHLAAAVCHILKEKGHVPVFQSVPELLERIRSTFNGKNKESEREIMNALRECDLLVLDDIGSEKVSDWVLETMFRIIDGRYRNKRPTMFTTNFSPTELLYRFMPKLPRNEPPSVEDEIAAKRIHDRIIEISTIVENKAQSYRMQVAQERRVLIDPEGKRKWAE